MRESFGAKHNFVGIYDLKPLGEKILSLPPGLSCFQSRFGLFGRVHLFGDSDPLLADSLGFVNSRELIPREVHVRKLTMKEAAALFERFCGPRLEGVRFGKKLQVDWLEAVSLVWYVCELPLSYVPVAKSILLGCG